MGDTEGGRVGGWVGGRQRKRKGHGTTQLNFIEPLRTFNKHKNPRKNRDETVLVSPSSSPSSSSSSSSSHHFKIKRKCHHFASLTMQTNGRLPLIRWKCRGKSSRSRFSWPPDSLLEHSVSCSSFFFQIRRKEGAAAATTATTATTAAAAAARRFNCKCGGGMAVNGAYQTLRFHQIRSS